jgi:hypothetical protein
MRTLKWALVLPILTVWVAAARSQEPTVPEGTTVKLLLLRQKSVQSELKLTAVKIRKVMSFTTKQYEAALKAIKLGAAERTKKFADLEKENKQFLEDNLSTKQSKRLQQITMQLTGLMQLSRPEVAKALNLTQDQTRKIKQLQTEARKGLAELMSDKGKEGRNEKLAKLREETRKKVLALMNDKQKAKIREMVGEPFKGKIEFEEAE